MSHQYHSTSCPHPQCLLLKPPLHALGMHQHSSLQPIYPLCPLYAAPFEGCYLQILPGVLRFLFHGNTHPAPTTSLCSCCCIYNTLFLTAESCSVTNNHFHYPSFSTQLHFPTRALRSPVTELFGLVARKFPFCAISSSFRGLTRIHFRRI